MCQGFHCVLLFSSFCNLVIKFCSGRNLAYYVSAIRWKFLQRKMIFQLSFTWVMECVCVCVCCGCIYVCIYPLICVVVALVFWLTSSLFLIPLTLLLNKEMTQKDDSSTTPQEDRKKKEQKNKKEIKRKATPKILIT